MPIRRNPKKEELPGQSPANQDGKWGQGKIEESPLARTAEYPGFRNRKQAARGGTRRAAAKKKITGTVEAATTKPVSKRAARAMQPREVKDPAPGKGGKDKAAAETPPPKKRRLRWK